jgi:hypothetical protein
MGANEMLIDLFLPLIERWGSNRWGNYLLHSLGRMGVTISDGRGSNMKVQQYSSRSALHLLEQWRGKIYALTIVGLMLTLLFFVFPGSKASGATTIYVDASATGAGTGSSWVDAYTSLQVAIEHALSGDQVWVAVGIYYPDVGGPPDDDPYTTFMLKNGVEIYGGFAGGETMLSQRDWETNVTVLSGDIDQNDTTDIYGVIKDVSAIYGTNAYHVVTGGGTDSSAVLDGFTITAGRANGTGQTNGAGMNNVSSSPTLVNLNFTGNWADGDGGGMRNYQSSPALTNVDFLSNQADYGGGMSNDSYSDPTLSGCNFSQNTAFAGGGMTNESYSEPTLTDVFFISNQASSYGGGMANNSSDPYLMGCSFRGNTAVTGGGGMVNDHSYPLIANVIFSGNQSQGGGGMGNTTSGPLIMNTVFAGNIAEVGGAMVNQNSSPQITNTVMWDNQATTEGDQIYNVSGSPTISYSDVQSSGGSGGGWDGTLGSDGGDNIDSDPLFILPVNPSSAPTTSGDLHLRSGSPGIDTGYDVACPPTDLDGNTRPIDGDLDGTAICDMGAYEATIDLFLPLIAR